MNRTPTKAKVLAILNRNKGVYYSGQELADSLGVTRAAVWKAIEKLRLEGYKIKGATNKGYALDVDADVLFADSIREDLSPKENKFYQEIVCLAETTSTNTLIKERYANFKPEGLVVSAETQTGGRGRFGRSFHSPAGSGVYFSLLLKPRGTSQKAALITAAAAVAGAKACEKINRNLKEGDVKIKWVNDLCLNGRKICGILTESSILFESGEMEYVVLGVGINLQFDAKNAPNELKKTVGGLFSKSAPTGARAKLIAAFLSEFYAIYEPLFKKGAVEEREAFEATLENYRRRLLFVGRKVDVVKNSFQEDEKRTATVVGVDEQFNLLVVYDDEPAKIAALNGGEIRARLKTPLPS